MEKYIFVEPFVHLPGHFKTYFMNIIKGSEDINTLFISYLNDNEISSSNHKYLYYSEKKFPQIPFITKFVLTYACLNMARKYSPNIVLIDGSYSAAYFISLLYPLNLGIVFPGDPTTTNFISLALYEFDKFFLDKIRNAKYIVHSPETKKYISNRQVSLIPWGVFPKNVNKLVTNDYLHFGTIEPRKNIEKIINLLEMIDYTGTFVIAGPPTNKEYLSFIEKLCSNCKIKTELAPLYLSEEEIDQLFSRCSKVILAYDHTFKGASGVFAHSASYGTPVIYNRTDSMSFSADIYGNGFPYSFSDAESFRTALLQEYKPVNLKTLSWHDVVSRYIKALE